MVDSYMNNMNRRCRNRLRIMKSRLISFNLKKALTRLTKRTGRGELRKNKKLVKQYMKNKRLDEDVKFNDVVSMMLNKSQKSVRKHIETASKIAKGKGKETIDIECFIDAEILLMYDDDVSKPDENCLEHKVAVVHQVGHLVVAEMLNPGCVGLVIVHDEITESRGYIRCIGWDKKQVDSAVLLAGVVATDMFADEAGYKGNEDDSEYAYSVVISNLRTIKSMFSTLFSIDSDIFMISHPSYLNQRRADKSFDDSYKKAEKILSENVDFVDLAVKRLDEKGYLLRSDIERLLKDIRRR